MALAVQKGQGGTGVPGDEGVDFEDGRVLAQELLLDCVTQWGYELGFVLR